MAIIAERARSEAQYPITFEGFVTHARDVLATRIVDIVDTFAVSELRITSSGEVTAYVYIPADMLPESLDKLADALREKWRRSELASAAILETALSLEVEAAAAGLERAQREWRREAE
jgi:hypothetical protein